MDSRLMMRILKVMGSGALLIPSWAWAQFGGGGDKLPTAPVTLSDEMSVDLTSGRRLDVYATLTIGASDNPSLSHTASFKQSGTELGGEIRSVCVAGQHSSCQTHFLTYSFGNRVEYSSDGANLTGGLISTYDSASQKYNVYDTAGRHWIFSRLPDQDGSSGQRLIAYLTEIRDPDGRRLLYGYSGPFSRNASTTMRSVVSIQSTDGFQLNHAYESDTILTNRRFVNCPVDSSSCPAADALWPQVAYSSSRVIVSGGPNLDLNNGVHFPSGNFVRYTMKQVTCTRFVAGYLGVSGSQGETPEYCLRVERIDSPRGTWTYTYNGNRMSVRDPTGAQHFSDVTDTEVVLTDRLNRVTRYKYVGSTFRAGDVLRYMNQRVSEVTYPEGNRDIYTYDSRFNVTKLVKQPKPGSGLKEQTWSAVYPSSCNDTNFRICNKPEYIVDANGNRTDYTYDAAHGGVRTETLPPDGNNVRAVRRHEYRQLAATYMDASGSMVAGPPIWRRIWTKECRNVAACDDTADEVTTAFEYNSNLLLRSVTVSADRTLRRTCFNHDRTGNRVSETKPRAGVTTCPQD